MQKQEQLILSQEYIWFWIDVTDKISWNIVFNNQVVFWERIYEILWHGDSLENIKETWWDAFESDRVKISYFHMQENIYKVKKLKEFERVVKYKILSIIQ